MECKQSERNEVLWDFGQYTSVHAMPRIIQTKCKAVKVIWCIIFVICCFLFVYSLATLLSTYLAYKTEQNTFTVQGHPVFPSVTVCNANPLRRSKLTGTLATKYGGQVPSRKKRSTQYDAKMEFLSLAAGLSDSERKSMEHQKNDMIIQCTYNGKPCGTNDLKYYHDPLYGACYVYNNPESRKSKVGQFAGLELTVNIEEAEYLNHVTPYYGAVVAIHASGTPPPLQEQALYVSPGYQTSVTVSQHDINQLPAPYSNCRDGGSGFEGCLKECNAKAVESECGCKSPLYETGGNICGVGTEADCAAKIMDNEDRECDCSRPCEETIYEHKTSFTQWPTQNYMATLKQEVGGISSSLDTSIASGKLRDNLLNLKVYFQRLEVEKTEMYASFTASRLLADIGISFLIFLGCSIISLIEIVELIILLIMKAVGKNGEPKKVEALA